MVRNTRLFDILQILRDGRLHRASDIAARLGVSPRTIYRDMDRLAATGVAIEGTRGTGYRMADVICLPPLNLSPDELEALNLGLAVVAQAADDSLKAAAQSLSNQLDAALSTEAEAQAAWNFAASPFADATRNLTHRALLRSAIKARQKVRITYTSPDGAVTGRVIRPLRMDYFGRIWSVLAWCEQADGFEAFRLDLMETIEALPTLFVDEPGKTLGDYVP